MEWRRPWPRPLQAVAVTPAYEQRERRRPRHQCKQQPRRAAASASSSRRGNDLGIGDGDSGEQRPQHDSDRGPPSSARWWWCSSGSMLSSAMAASKEGAAHPLRQTGSAPVAFSIPKASPSQIFLPRTSLCRDMIHPRSKYCPALFSFLGEVGAEQWSAGLAF
uniref:Uncharacterized protein n=1 Tax=Oryza punctata TaxID=4537 RepID=A0A0E0K666_ORYPU